MIPEEKKPGVKRLAIIDGKSVFYRGYYAMPNLSTKDGTPTGGVFGFATMALEVIKRLKPDYVCVAWDKPKTNIRKRLEMYPEYKAGRKPAPPDFYEQIPVLHELLGAFGWPLYELDDYEADDIMGTLAVQARAKGIDTALITSDLDLLQVINGNVHVYALKKGLSNIELYNPKSFEEKYGVSVEQFLDLKSIKGDSSDNIPGVPGIGEKGAVELLREYKTLDGIYDNLDKIKETTRKKLEAGKDLAYLSKKLAAIWTDAPIKLDLKEVDGGKCDPVKLRELLEKLEFKTLARNLPEYMHVPGETDKTLPAKLTIGSGLMIKTNAELEKLTLPKVKELVIHSESEVPHGLKPKLLTISTDPKTVITFDLTTLDKKAVGEKLKEYIESVKLVGYDIKSTLQVLLSLGIDTRNVEHDVSVGAFLINSLRRDLSLVDLAASDLNIHLEEGAYSDVEAVAVIRKLHKNQVKELEDMPKVAKLAHDIEWPIIPVLAQMEFEGIKLDTKYLEKFSLQIDDMISDLEQQIYGHADSEFNIGSPAQLADVLFEKLKLPTQGIKKGKTGYSTAATELDKLRSLHPIIDLITQYREVTKLKNTYVDTLPQQVDENSRLHTTFSLTVAQTGRLSSNDPNLQNIPVRSELGKHIRTAFEAGPGNVFVSADYSQFELRLAAYLCGDKDLMEQFNKDVDVHVATAAEVYGRKPEDVTKNMRRDAKVVNFGVMYGLSTHGLVAATGMNYDQAKKFIEKYFEVRPKLKGYIDSVKKQAHDKGYVENLFGRRRPTPDVKSSNFMVREGAIRAAVNMPFQGGAADIMKKAMVDLGHMIDDLNRNHSAQEHSHVDVAQGGKEEQASRTSSTKSERQTPADTAIRHKHTGMASFAGQQSNAVRMLLQIHDSILIECPKADAEKLAKKVKEVMEGVVDLPVKLTVDTTTGQNWGEL